MGRNHNHECERFAHTFIAICEDLKVSSMPSATWQYLVEKENPCNNCRQQYLRIQSPFGNLSATLVKKYYDEEVMIAWTSPGEVVDLFEK